MKIQTIPVGQLQANCYMVSDELSGKTVIIDPGDDGEFITQTVLDQKLKPVALLATHGHFDHVMAGYELQKNFDIPFYIDKKDAFLLDRLSETASYFLGKSIVAINPETITYLDVVKELYLEPFVITPISTPGHTPGSVSFYFEKEQALFVGDVLFAGGGYGRTDFSYCSQKDLFESIKTLLKLPKQTTVYCGHGEETSIEKEAKLLNI